MLYYHTPAVLFAICLVTTSTSTYGMRLAKKSSKAEVDVPNNRGRRGQRFSPRRKLNTSAFSGGGVDALTNALQIVGKSGSEDLRKIVDTFQPVYMITGGTSQGKDSLMMMLMGLPFAFQGAGVATRCPVLYRTFPSSDGKTSVTMRTGAGQKGVQVDPTQVVPKLAEHMASLGDTFSDVPVDITVSCPTCRQSIYKNMMGRVVGTTPESKRSERMIDKIYDTHAAPTNTMVVAVEKVSTLSVNSMIMPFIFKTDKKGERTVYIKSWADYGISEVSAESGTSCSEAQAHFAEFDFKKQADTDEPTFWIATVKEGPYIQDHSLTIQERIDGLEDAIAKQEDKMTKFFEGWAKEGCDFDFKDHVYVTQLRDHVASVHQKTMFKRLPEILGALKKEIDSMEKTLKRDENTLKKMTGGDTPSMEILSLMSTFQHIFDEQWMGEQLPTRELTKRQIENIQSKYYDMTAVQFATEFVKEWQKRGPAEFQDQGFDRRLIEVANMLRYDTADQHLTYSSHYWLHLTNMYMLLVRSIKDLLEPRDPNRRSNIGNVGRTGADDCNAAVIEAKYAFRKGGSEKGLKLMQFGIRFILEKHIQASQEIFMNLPSVQGYLSDNELMGEMRLAQAQFVDEWTETFGLEYQKFLYMVTTNIQQGKVLKLLNTMTLEQEEQGEKAMIDNSDIKKCEDISGAESRDKSKFPLCKCKVNTRRSQHVLFCGVEPVDDPDDDVGARKFNVTWVLQQPACKYSKPYCSGAAKQHQLTDLAKLLNPKPENCETLYDELVDSSIDILVNNVGSLMYYMAYDHPEEPIIKRNGFAMQLFEKIKGEGGGYMPEDVLAAKFPSLGQKKKLADKVMKQKQDIADIEQAYSFFQKAYMTRRN